MNIVAPTSFHTTPIGLDTIPAGFCGGSTGRAGPLLVLATHTVVSLYCIARTYRKRCDTIQLIQDAKAFPVSVTCIARYSCVCYIFYFLAVSVQTPIQSLSWQWCDLCRGSGAIHLPNRRYFFGAAIPPAPLALPVLGVAPVWPAPLVTVSWPPAFGLDSREAGPPFWLSLIVPSGLVVGVFVCAKADADVIATRIEAMTKLLIEISSRYRPLASIQTCWSNERSMHKMTRPASKRQKHTSHLEGYTRWRRRSVRRSTGSGVADRN